MPPTVPISNFHNEQDGILKLMSERIQNAMAEEKWVNANDTI